MKYPTKVFLLILGFSCVTGGVMAADQPASLDLQDSTLLLLPAEGRWSIGLGWDNEWPAQWHHATAERWQTYGEWTRHYGTISLPQGDWHLRDEVRQVEPGLLMCRRRWVWKGPATLEKVTLSVRWKFQANQGRPFLPGISYYNNPAGASVDASKIPVISLKPRGRGFYEEHRFPMPLAAVEAMVDQTWVGAALHSLPSPLRFGKQEDQWWSLGLAYQSDGVELALLSGAVASNGKNGVIKARQSGFHPYPDAWLDVPPGAIIDKTFYVQLYPAAKRGSAFRPALWKSVELFQPYSTEGMPALKEVIGLKFIDTLRRWHEDNLCAGVDAFPGEDRPWIDLGWAGQSEAVSYPLIVLGQSYDVPRKNQMAQKAMDFISQSPFNKDGFAIRYDYGRHQWFPNRNPLSQAQAMQNMLNALRVARSDPAFDTTSWEAFLRKACEYHADRVEKDDWHPKSTNEGFLIAPLAQAAGMFDQPRYLEVARKIGDHYGARHLSMDEPYWGGTLDARCEDKEGAWAALQGFLALHEITGDMRYLDWAGHAADVIVSYVYVWDVPMPPGRLADHGFKSRGWTSVSVQNMHLDVYGVLCAPALYRLGELTRRDPLKKLARLMMVSCGQLVDGKGGQGEQLHQTHYAQHYQVNSLKGVRGDYVESWDVYWITAHFLTAAAQFEEMKVDWKTW